VAVYAAENISVENIRPRLNYGAMGVGACDQHQFAADRRRSTKRFEQMTRRARKPRRKIKIAALFVFKSSG
jgi:hypothetical protein